MTQLEQIKIANSRVEAILLTLGSLGFVAAGIFILLEPEGDDILVSWMATLFFGGCALVGFWMLFDTRPRLIIDRAGIYDRTIGVGKIPWSDINNAYIRSIRGNDFICLELRNQNAYLQKLSSIQRFLAQANLSLGFTPISLNLSGVDANSYQVLELILKYVELHSNY